MNQGIEILLARMDSNPEEFGSNATRGGRWHYLLAPLLGEDRPKQSWATPEEIEAVQKKYHSIQGETFTKNVLKELLEDEQVEKVKDKLNVPWTAANKAGPGVYTSPHVNLTQRMTLPSRTVLDGLFDGSK